MNAFVRQLAVLAALWALCELLLPQGRQQQMVRMAVSLLVMIALVSSLGRLAGSIRETEWPVYSAQQTTQALTGYQRIVLTSAANQAESLCLRMASKAGYEAQAAVYLRGDGTLEQVQLRLSRGNTPPLMEEGALAQLIAEQLGADPEQVIWQPLSGEAVP